MSTNIDPQRVLKLINSMGYKNVSPNELKDFTKDLKKLVKYEQKSKGKTTSSKHHPRIRTAPENIINVTIVKESSPQKVDQVPTMKSEGFKATAENSTHQQNEQTEQPDVPGETKQSKRLLRLPKHIKTRNPKIVYKKGIGSGTRNGVLVRNTPTDLYQKYQEDWIKFKAFIPGESSRTQLRRSIRRKMQHKDSDDDAKVYVHFPDETGDQ